LPVLYALQQSGPEADRLRQLLSRPVEDDADLAEALGLLRSSPGIGKAKEMVRSYAAQARDELAELPEGPGRQALAALVDYTVNRHG
jgi:heptaprenyl diphosphate synthase